MQFNVVNGLEQEIENLYKVFAQYRLGKHIDACPCCVHDEDQNRIRSKTLKELSAADLSRYAEKALTTWGNENNFRHFLPRLFEIIVYEPVALTDPEILFGKLPYARWRNWPLKEQEAIENYFSALWIYQLSGREPDDFTNIGSYLCGIVRAKGNVQPYLALWESSKEPTARNHLEMFVMQNSKELHEGRLKLGFWSTCPEQAASIVEWITKQEYLNILGDSPNNS